MSICQGSCRIVFVRSDACLLIRMASMSVHFLPGQSRKCYFVPLECEKFMDGYYMNNQSSYSMLSSILNSRLMHDSSEYF